jgi:predicted O-methyltransferase YrrM
MSSLLYNPVTSKEKDWIKRIEQERRELKASREQVTLMDYGSRVPGQGTQSEPTVTREVGKVCRTASKSRFWAQVLFRLVRTFKPETCLELGTCLGVSAAYQAAALELNRIGSITTLEGAAGYVAVAKGVFSRLGLSKVNTVTGRFQDTLGTVLPGLDRPLDYVFIDGHHDGKATQDYFSRIRPFLNTRALVVFDDIFWSDMRKAWLVIRQENSVASYADLYSVGICLVEGPGHPRSELKALP